jgi:HAD superfamily hydrolase (TIGR01509 family)
VTAGRPVNRVAAIREPYSRAKRKDAGVQGPRLVIFDCDGVLVDSESISNDVLARRLSAEGLPTTLAEARRDYQGMLLSEVLAAAQHRLGRQLPPDWLRDYERERAAVFRRELQPVPGAAEAVARVAAAGVGVCVASQGKLEKTTLSLELTGLRHLFAARALFSAASVARGKPHPDVFLHAAATMRTPPAACVVVEDTPSGVTAAVAAGMRVMGYCADSDARALRRAGAELLHALTDLPHALGLTRTAPPQARSRTRAT